MQKLASTSTGELEEEFASQWDVLVRFVTSRRLRSSVYRGPAADLSHSQLAALTALSDGDARMRDLAARLGAAESSATRLVDRLEAAGLAERRSATDDRRCVEATLTEEGRRVVGTVAGERRALVREILGTLEVPERAELVRLFGTVTAALRERELEGPR